MSIPIRCFTCNKVIANKWLTYQKYQSEGISDGEALDKVELVRICCRRMFLGHVELDVIALDASSSTAVRKTMQDMMAMHQMPNGPSAKVVSKSNDQDVITSSKAQEGEENYFGPELSNSMDVS